MNHSLRKNKNFKAGIGVAELLVYIGIMTLALVSIVTLLINSAKIMKSVQVEKEVRISATNSLERMMREIKNSEEVIIADSVFNSPEGRLAVTSRFASDTSQKVLFFVNEEGSLEITQDGASAGTLTSHSAVVDELRFKKFNHGTSESVRIELTLSDKRQPAKKTTFYSTAVLRGSY